MKTNKVDLEMMKHWGGKQVENNGVTITYLGVREECVGWINGQGVDVVSLKGFESEDVGCVTADNKDERDRIVAALKALNKRVVKTGYKKVYFLD